jgi:hypothetical protein
MTHDGLDHALSPVAEFLQMGNEPIASLLRRDHQPIPSGRVDAWLLLEIEDDALWIAFWPPAAEDVRAAFERDASVEALGAFYQRLMSSSLGDEATGRWLAPDPRAPAF